MDEPLLGRLHHLMTIREGVETLSAPLNWPRPGNWNGGNWPQADWADEGTHLTLWLDVPGVQPGTLSLSEEGERLTVSGERVAAPPHLLSSERPQGQFSRTLEFPQAVVPQTGEASLSGGVLSVRFEKKHPTIDVCSQCED